MNPALSGASTEACHAKGVGHGYIRNAELRIQYLCLSVSICGSIFGLRAKPALVTHKLCGGTKKIKEEMV